MDGGKSYPQHEHQQPGNALYSIPGLRSQLAMPAVQVRPRQLSARRGAGLFAGRQQEGSEQSQRSWDPWACLRELDAGLPRQLSRGTRCQLGMMLGA